MTPGQPSIQVTIPQNLQVTVTPGETPADIREWLLAHGWKSAAHYGYWTTYGTNMSLTWEQAVAYEAYRFMSLGGK